MEISGTEHGAGRILIRRSSLDDLPQLIAISQAAEYAARWGERQWRDIFHTQIPPRLAWMAWDVSGLPKHPDLAPRGFLGAEPLLSEAQAQASGQSGFLAASRAAIGFLVAQCGGAEWELENMAVLPGFRRRGAGAALLAALLAEARARQAERILLEVRPSNQSAIHLYGQGGFALLARRPDYYRDPVEDALIMVRLLQGSA